MEQNTVSSVEAAGEIHQELYRQEELVEMLDVQLDVLVERIMPILADRLPQKEDAKEELRESSVAMTLQRQRLRLEDVHSKITETLERVRL